MQYTYKTKGTCSSQIQFDLEGGIVTGVKFTGGCNGNLKAISKLVEGMEASRVVELLRGYSSCRMSLQTHRLRYGKEACLRGMHF